MDIQLFTKTVCGSKKASINCPACLSEIMLDIGVFKGCKEIECHKCDTKYEIKKRSKNGTVVRIEPISKS